MVGPPRRCFAFNWTWVDSKTKLPKSTRLRAVKELQDAGYLRFSKMSDGRINRFEMWVSDTPHWNPSESLPEPSVESPEDIGNQDGTTSDLQEYEMSQWDNHGTDAGTTVGQPQTEVPLGANTTPDLQGSSESTQGSSESTGMVKPDQTDLAPHWFDPPHHIGSTPRTTLVRHNNTTQPDHVNNISAHAGDSDESRNRDSACAGSAQALRLPNDSKDFARDVPEGDADAAQEWVERDIGRSLEGFEESILRGILSGCESWAKGLKIAANTIAKDERAYA